MCKIERILESEGFGASIINDSYILIWRGEISSSHTDKSTTYFVKGATTYEQFATYCKEVNRVAAKYPNELSFITVKRFCTIDDMRTDSTEPLIRF